MVTAATITTGRVDATAIHFAVVTKGWMQLALVNVHAVITSLMEPETRHDELSKIRRRRRGLRKIRPRTKVFVHSPIEITRLFDKIIGKIIRAYESTLKELSYATKLVTVAQFV